MTCYVSVDTRQLSRATSDVFNGEPKSACGRAPIRLRLTFGNISLNIDSRFLKFNPTPR